MADVWNTLLVGYPLAVWIVYFIFWSLVGLFLMSDAQKHGVKPDNAPLIFIATLLGSIFVLIFYIIWRIGKAPQLPVAQGTGNTTNTQHVHPDADPESRGAESPLHILKARYARGEITKREFERMKKTLES